MPVTLEDTVEAMLEELVYTFPVPKPEPVRPLHDATPEERPFVSVIVPVDGCHRELPDVLDRLSDARAALHRRLGKRTEILVSGYGEPSSRLVYVEEFDARLVDGDAPTLSAAVNAAANAARGGLLVLVTPDLRPSEQCLCHICETAGDAGTLGGGSAVSAPRRGLTSALAAFVARIPLRLNGLSLGVYFVWKSTFESVGGFSEWTFSGEILEFALRLKRHAAASGKRLANVREVCATTQGDGYVRLATKEWCRLLFLPLLRRR